MELDLAKAYDNLNHDIALEALLRSGVPQTVAYLCAAVWKAPRFCTVGRQMAAPTRPTRGLPQGDSMAPTAMIASLTPWAPHAGSAYMDDRTLVAVSTPALDDDPALIERFDQECGFRGNASKRQRWSEDDAEPSRVEHLGLPAVPTNIHEPILPKHGWEKLYIPRNQDLACHPGRLPASNPPGRGLRAAPLGLGLAHPGAGAGGRAEPPPAGYLTHSVLMVVFWEVLVPACAFTPTLFGRPAHL